MLVKMGRVSVFVPSASLEGYETVLRRYRGIISAGILGQKQQDEVEMRLQEASTIAVKLRERLVRKRLFCAVLCWKPSISQDRLGTDTGKVDFEKRYVSAGVDAWWWRAGTRQQPGG